MRHPLQRACVASLALVLPATAALAEVSTSASGASVATIIIGSIVDDPEPIGLWLQYRLVQPHQVLNPDGHARGDGRPDVTIASIVDDPEPIGKPLATWAYNVGIDHDIAFSEWTAGAWSPIEFLTASTDDDLDPRIFAAPDGDLHIVWWTHGLADRVWWATRPAGSSAWNPPVGVAAGGRRPSIAVFDGAVRIAFERTSPVAGMAQDVVVLRAEPGGGFTEEFVASTPRTQPLDAVLQTAAGQLWVDWKHWTEVFGCAELTPAGWTGVQYVAWTDASWIGVEQTRRAVRSVVIGD